MWSGISRSILNCSRGWISIAKSAVLVVPPAFRAGVGLISPVVARGPADAGDRAVNVQHTGSDTQKEQHDHPPRPRAEPAIDRPTQAGPDRDRDNQLDADAEAKAEPLLQNRAVLNHGLRPDALRPRLVDLFAKPRQRIPRPAFAHSGKRNHRCSHRRYYRRSAAHHSDTPEPSQRGPARRDYGLI